MMSAVAAAVAATVMEQAHTGLGCYISCYSLRRKQGLLIGRGGVSSPVGSGGGGGDFCELSGTKAASEFRWEIKSKKSQCKKCLAKLFTLETIKIAFANHKSSKVVFEWEVLRV